MTNEEFDSTSIPPAPIGAPPVASAPNAEAPAPVAVAPAAKRARRPRLEAIDVARSLAIFGMFTAHLGAKNFESGGLSPSILDVTMGRSAALFMILAGVGTALLARLDQHDYSRGLPRQPRLFPFFWIRAAYLWGISIVLIKTQFPVYVILGIYACIFIAAPFFIHLFKPWVTFVVAAAAVGFGFHLTGLYNGGPDGAPGFDSGLPLMEVIKGQLVAGAYPFLVYVAYFLVGFGCVQLNLGRLRTRVGMVVGGGITLGAVLIGNEIAQRDNARALIRFEKGDYTYNDTLHNLLDYNPHSHTLADIVGNIGFGVLVIGALLLIWNDGKGGWRRLFAPFVAAGRMPLTLYAGHIIIGDFISQDGDIVYNDSNLDLLAFILVALAFAWAWSALLGRGPLEAIMRWISDWVRPKPTTTEATVASAPPVTDASWLDTRPDTGASPSLPAASDQPSETGTSWPETRPTNGTDAAAI